MLGRRGGARRNRHLRDRGDAHYGHASHPHVALHTFHPPSSSTSLPCSATATAAMNLANTPSSTAAMRAWYAASSSSSTTVDLASSSGVFPSSIPSASANSSSVKSNPNSSSSSNSDISSSMSISAFPNVTFTWPDPNGRRPCAILVASFDNFLHHRMFARVGGITGGVGAGGSTISDLVVTLSVPPGRHTYKFLVDGVWTTHAALHALHPIEVSPDGVKHHVLIVEPLVQAHIHPPPHPTIAPVASAHERHLAVAAPAMNTRVISGDPRASVFRSASASAVQAINTSTAGGPRPSIPHPSISYGNSPSAVDIIAADIPPPRARLMAPRGSSFNTAPASSATPSTLSASALSRVPPEHRRSLLHRVGSGWRRRFSNRTADHLGLATASAGCYTTGPPSDIAQSSTQASVPSPAHSLSRSNFPTAEHYGSAIFRSQREAAAAAVLFPSSSEPVVSRCTEDKENIAHSHNAQTTRGPAPATPDRRRGHTIRASSRSNAVKVSMPMRVDEPRNSDEVNRHADNWRQMARHLQDNLHDPSGARELLAKAIAHREKHGLAYTAANAQVHTDLARNLSKADKITDAESHLRTALDIFDRLGMGSEQCADLKLYIGVMVDRQKRRQEAEILYRQALDMYRIHGVKGNNMNIAIKNLVLNLKKQNRGHEVVSVYGEYGRNDD